MSSQRSVSSAGELQAAVEDPATRSIVVKRSLEGLPTLRLAPSQALEGGDPDVTLAFSPDCDGLQLTKDNRVDRLRLLVTPDRSAVCNDLRVDTLGTLSLRRLKTVGGVRLLADGAVQSGHIHVDGLDIEVADGRRTEQGPRGFGVEVVSGAFTVWNRQADPKTKLTAEITDLSLGRPDAPVHGSGVFISGAGPNGGRVEVSRLETQAVYSNGGIAEGVGDRISGGVFVVHGAHAKLVRNRGPVTTYGVNDMVLDNWGTVERWIAEQPITSHGPSGIGFVNFGSLDHLEVSAIIETFGLGARGFNIYDGVIGSASFERVVTHGDGAVGVQISKPMDELKVLRGIETFGGQGKSLVKGVIMELPAIAFSVKPGGSIRKVTIAGGVVAHGVGIEAFQLHGEIGELHVQGGFSSSGGGFEGI